MKSLLVIPALNEETKIARVVKSVPAGAVDEICVVDDGSSDTTAAVAGSAGATVIRHGVNRGVGAAIRSGIEYAIKKGFDTVVCISGDDQHDSSEIPGLIKVLKDEGYDLVQGSRYLEGGKIVNPTPFRFWGIKLYSLLLRIFFPVKITDGTNGFRAFRTGLFINTKINIWQKWLDRYELEPYILIKTIKLGYRVKEVPVTVKYHADGSFTKMKPLKGWWSLFRPVVFLSLGLRR